MSKLHDIIVVSDLHLGRGRNARTRRYYPLEAFFYDADFLAFCRHLCDDARENDRPFKLVFNGDAFDLLRVEPESLDGATGRERRYGPALTPPVAAHIMSEILAGHPQFVTGLATVLAAGYQIIFLPGNHDIEIQWQAVQTAITAAVQAALGEVMADEEEGRRALARLTFKPWFHYEEGRAWIEHGCQYDPENAFRYPLRGGLEQKPEWVIEAERDLPLGNFFQRYLYNDFGHITFIVPTARANLRYMKWLLINQPRLLFGVIFSHLPFLVQFLRRFAKAVETRSKKALRSCHEKELHGLCESEGLGERLQRIDDLKETQADVVQATRTIGWQGIKILGAVALVALMFLGLWFMGFLGINQLKTGFGWKTLLFLALNFMALVATTVAVVWSIVRTPPEPEASPFRQAAEKIHDIVEVPIVTFGHTHDEVIWPIGSEAYYFNTGTWIAVFTHDVLMPRERVQYTFLRIREHEGELLQWSPGRGEPIPVILLEESRGANSLALLATTGDPPQMPGPTPPG